MNEMLQKRALFYVMFKAESIQCGKGSTYFTLRIFFMTGQQRSYRTGIFYLLPTYLTPRALVRLLIPVSLLPVEHTQCSRPKKLIQSNLPDIKIHIHVLIFFQKNHNPPQRRLEHSPRHPAAVMQH